MPKNTLYITRKRKKWKYWHFDQFKNCLHLADIKPKDLRGFLEGAEKVVLEIGAGTANLSLAIAKQNPDYRVIAVDLKSDRLYTGAKTAQVENLDNLLFLRGHAQQLREVLKPACLDLIWITFPDPFSKERQEKHRLTQQRFLELYRFLLRPGGVVKFKTDSKQLFDWSILEFEKSGWQITELSRDLHGGELPEDCQERALTTYEIKFKNLGNPIYYLQARVKKNPKLERATT